MPISEIQQIPVAKLRPNPTNIRTHPKKQIAALARLIDQIGFVVPVVVDERSRHGNIP
jgi:ParB-like chromosome segregation protein Spo0J